MFLPERVDARLKYLKGDIIKPRFFYETTMDGKGYNY